MAGLANWPDSEPTIAAWPRTGGPMDGGVRPVWPPAGRGGEPLSGELLDPGGRVLPAAPEDGSGKHLDWFRAGQSEDEPDRADRGGPRMV
jgi:hypothetical protein